MADDDYKPLEEFTEPKPQRRLYVSPPPRPPAGDDYAPMQEYKDPIGAKPLQPNSPPAPDVGYGEDIGKGIVGGLERGVTGLIGMPGQIGTIARAAADKVFSKDTADRLASIAHGLGYVLPPFALFSHAPDVSQVEEAVKPYTGEFYRPQTVPGQYASTLAEFAPGALLGGEGVAAKIINTVIPALTSETAGQLTKGSSFEPWARFIGGVGGGLAGAKAITPTAPVTAARAGMMGTLEREGIPLSAGERTGSNAIRYLESSAGDMPFASSRAAAMREAQSNAIDQAVTHQMFDRGQLTARGVPPEVNLPDPRVVNAGRQSLQDEYTRLSQNNFRADRQLFTDLFGHENTYHGNVLPGQRSAAVTALNNDLVNELAANNWVIPGNRYQAWRSRLNNLADAAQNGTDAYLSPALRGQRNALDAAMQRSLTPADAMAWRLNNQRYAIMKQLMPTVAASGEHLSPLGVAQAARSGRADLYARQQGQLDQLAKAAATVLKPLPNSGTAARQGWHTLLNLPTLMASGTTGTLGGILGGPLGAVAGTLLPSALARTALSRVGQTYLGNQWLPQNARDILAQTLAQQAITQPSGIRRNQEERAAYQRGRKAKRIQMGLPG